MAELVGGEPDSTAGWGIDDIPNEIAQRNGEFRGPQVAGRWHLHPVARQEHDFSEDTADGLREAAAGILCGRARIREAAIPGWAAAYRARGKAVNDLYRGERRHGDEGEDQEPIIGTAALGDRHDRQPRIGGL